MKGCKHSTNNSFLSKLFLSNILLFFIPVIIAVLIFNVTAQIIERHTLDSHAAILEQTKTVIDGKLSEIESLANQIISNPDLLKLRYLNEPFKTQNIYSILNTQKAYYNFRLTNSFIFDSFIAYRKSKLVLSPTHIDVLDGFHENYMQSSNINCEDFSDYVFNTLHVQSYLPINNFLINHTSHNIIAFMRSSPYATSPTGIVTIFFIYANQFEKLLEGIDVSQGGGVYIVDENHNVMSCVGKIHDEELQEIFADNSIMAENEYIHQKNINGRDMLINSTTSDLNNWKYISVIPTYVIMDNLTHLKSKVYTLLGIVQFLGLIAAYISASRSSAPVRLLVDDHNALEDAMDKQLPMLKNAFLDDLIKGEFRSEQEIYEQAAMLDIDLNAHYYLVAVLQLGKDSLKTEQDAIIRLNREKLIIIDLLKSTIRPLNIYFVSPDIDKISLIFVYSGDSFKDFEGYIRNKINKFNSTLGDHGYYNLIWSVGEIYESPLNISRSYAESIELLNYHQVQKGENGIVYHSDMPKTSDFYYFPIDIQRRLANYTRSGDFKNTKQLLNDIYIENLFKRQVSAYMTHALIGDLWCNLFKVLEQNPFNDQPFIDNIQALAMDQEQIDLTDRLEICMDIYYSVSKKFYAHKDSHNIALIEQILSYIKDSYNDMNLSLTLIADKFSISDAYLSSFFKEQTGENFYYYLQELRIKKAKELLLQTDMPVAEIVDTIGYSSYNTFAKAFKRIVGMTATEYRFHQ